MNNNFNIMSHIVLSFRWVFICIISTLYIVTLCCWTFFDNIKFLCCSLRLVKWEVLISQKCRKFYLKMNFQHLQFVFKFTNCGQQLLDRWVIPCKQSPKNEIWMNKAAASALILRECYGCWHVCMYVEQDIQVNIQGYLKLCYT